MPNISDRFVRSEILRLLPYHVPPSSGMIKLDAMENPYSLPDVLRKEIAQLVAAITTNRYPDSSCASLKAILCETMEVPSEMDIILGNGSDEIIQIIALSLAKPGAILMSIEPSFIMFRMIAAYTNMKYVGIPLRANFELDLDFMLEAILKHQPAVIFIAYPNNPTGNLFDVEAVSRIIESAPGVVVIDEAYHAFADSSFIGKLSEYPNLLLMRTLSKLGLAGLRLGFLVGRTEWLMQLEKIRLPYNIGILTQVVAKKILQHPDILQDQVQAIKAERVAMNRNLNVLDGVEAFPSDANFILFRIRKASKIFSGLKQRNILIKNLDGSHPLLKNCLRVTIGTPDENRQFLRALQECIMKVGN
ncbi:MAG: histidinol-phosphate transaminase [Nitrosomonadaceae bacterium]|nr:histidinol-phosphate transaminase [Nitrosomonadaceae bacterium]|tara:strand:+ start:863 stop:1945 length:1083 start_codon:yes stop_codon:yes gene_type:complete